jgi:hypothetical protein
MGDMKRSGLILLAVVLAALAIAGMVVTRSDGSRTATMSSYEVGGGDVGYAADSAGTGSTDPVEAALDDPAKDKPILDKFHSKDPFTPHFIVGASGGTTGGGTGSNPSSSPSATPLAPVGADIKLNGTVYKNQKSGDKLPPSNAVFGVTKVTSSGVVFKIINGWELPDFTKTLTVAEGETQDVTVVKGSETKEFTITVVAIIFKATGGGGTGTGGGGTGGSGGTLGGSSVTQGTHYIKVVSIDSQNGSASATLVVDGVTYANKKVGAVFQTGWGEIKILGINAAAQTVTILHGDQRITLQVGQSFAK